MAVELPWEDVTGDARIVHLLLSTRETTALQRNYVNAKVWKPALLTAGLLPTRENGMHALRHFYASVLLDAGESIRALAEYLGHADPGFTLRVYTHLMPASEERTKRAVDQVLRGAMLVDGSTARRLDGACTGCAPPGHVGPVSAGYRGDLLDVVVERELVPRRCRLACADLKHPLTCTFTRWLRWLRWLPMVPSGRLAD